MRKILVIEDDETLEKAYAEVFRQEGFEVFIAATGGDGLKILAHESIDIVLLDIMLPGGMNGFEFLREIKRDEKLKTIPVVVLSNLESERQTAMDYGAAEYLFKANMGMHSLVEKVKQQLPSSS